MKKGTEKVIAHLPIECATFLLNEKRHSIEQIEARLKVGIVILPSKHLETPAYDIERIKEKDSGDEKPSYLQLKAEDITIPEFARQVKPAAEKPAIKEFLHETPAPMQNKNESTSLIKRFWHKLVGPGKESPSKKPAVKVVEKTKTSDESFNNRNRNNKRGSGRNQEPRLDQAPRDQEKSQETRPVRNLRGPGRNVKRNLDPANLPPTKLKPVVNVPAPEQDVIIPASESEASVPNGESPRKPNGRGNSRRGPNRRRSRNSNYRKAVIGEGEGSNSTDDSSSENQVERRVASLPAYGDVFVEKEQPSERKESQQDTPPIRVDNDNQS
jgi:ribonuclease E